MPEYEALYRDEETGEAPSRTAPLKATDEASALEEAKAGHLPHEKSLAVREVEDDGVFTVDHSEVDGPDRLG